MSKMTDYQAGREDGLLLAERIVKEGGLERLQEEIKYRGITGVHTQLAKKRDRKSVRSNKNDHRRHDPFIGTVNGPGRIWLRRKEDATAHKPDGTESHLPDRGYGNVGGLPGNDKGGNRD